MVRQDHLVSRSCLVNCNNDRIFPKGETAKSIRKNINSTPILKIVSFSIDLAGQLMCMGITIICNKIRTKRQYKPPTVLIYRLNRYPRNASVVTKAVYRKADKYRHSYWYAMSVSAYSSHSPVNAFFQNRTTPSSPEEIRQSPSYVRRFWTRIGKETTHQHMKTQLATHPNACCQRRRLPCRSVWMAKPLSLDDSSYVLTDGWPELTRFQTARSRELTVTVLLCLRDDC